MAVGTYAVQIDDLRSRPRPLGRSDADALVVARHRAGRDAILTPPTPLPETPMVDIFEGVSGLPEVHRDDLTHAEITCGIRRHGALIVRGLLDGPTREPLLARLDADPGVGAPVTPLDSSGSELDGVPPMTCTPATLQALLDAYEQAGLIDAVTAYLGERPVALSDRVRLRRKVIKAGLPWHQDAAYFGGTSPRSTCGSPSPRVGRRQRDCHSSPAASTRCRGLMPESATSSATTVSSPTSASPNSPTTPASKRLSSRRATPCCSMS